MVACGDKVQLFRLADASEKLLGMGIWYNGVTSSVNYLNKGKGRENWFKVVVGSINKKVLLQPQQIFLWNVVAKLRKVKRCCPD